ncbi:MAG: molybdenum cofactor guanylyltransferase [Actinomycetota bacterium]
MADALCKGVGHLLQPVHAGLLLTGGRSIRMGRDKASIVIGGASLAEHAAAALRAATSKIICVGPDSGTGLPSIIDRGEGPLIAFDEGCRWLQDHGHEGPIVALACDMPFVTAEILTSMAAIRHGADAVVPIAKGRLQPLAAIYAPAAFEHASKLIERGSRSMRDLLAHIRLEVVPASTLGANEDAFDDIDTPQDLERVTALL